MIGFILATGTFVLPESPRWLIDKDKEKEGLRVIADLHSGDLNDPLALVEYQEIKDKVLQEVRVPGDYTFNPNNINKRLDAI